MNLAAVAGHRHRAHIARAELEVDEREPVRPAGVERLGRPAESAAHRLGQCLLAAPHAQELDVPVRAERRALAVGERPFDRT